MCDKLKSINLFTQTKEVKTPETMKYGFLFTMVYAVGMLVIVIVLVTVQSTTKQAVQITLTNPAPSDYIAAQQYSPVCQCGNTIFPYGSVTEVGYYNGVCATGWDTFCSFTNATGLVAADDMNVDSLVTPNVVSPSTLAGLVGTRYSTMQDQFTSTIRASCGMGVTVVFQQAVFAQNGYINYSKVLDPTICEDSKVFGTYIAGWTFTSSESAAQQYTNYFAACKPSQCTYTKDEIPPASAIAVYLFGVLGGAHAALSGVCGAVVGFLVGESVAKAQKADPKGGSEKEEAGHP